MSLIDDEVKTGLQDLFMDFVAYSFFALTIFCCVQFNCRDRNSCTVRVPAAITMLTTTITENMQYACNSLRPTVDALSQTKSHRGSYAASIVQKKPWWYIRHFVQQHFTHFAFFRTRAATDSVCWHVPVAIVDHRLQIGESRGIATVQPCVMDTDAESLMCAGTTKGVRTVKVQ